MRITGGTIFFKKKVVIDQVVVSGFGGDRLTAKDFEL